jgi:phosphoribosylformylglycinamidine synthase II
MSIDPETLKRHDLSVEEYERIVQAIGRTPSLTELGIFSVMWSEHCSYKSSRVYLRTLPTESPRVLQGPGENAGAVDIGDGVAAVFKIESHNHPSFIEPYQGAATGVGGIVRDIFTMGARPIALLNSLRFGVLDDPFSRRVFEGVVDGIADYGNSLGIPTVGGEVAFDESYAGNPLVNVFCLGLVKSDALVKGRADGVGNPVYYVGAKTGRDGIHGATMASAEFDEHSSEKRPAVQVGDPFIEKLLLEACLELMETDVLVGLQDMGAAGLTCSMCEMGARSGSGIEIDIDLVPRREAGMNAYEVMLSESQERMLLVAKRGCEQEVERIFQKWDLHAVRVGRVTDSGMLCVTQGGTTVAEIPNRALVDDVPVYRRPIKRPEWLDERQQFNVNDLERLASPEESLLRLLGSGTIASKRWVYRQYDHMVRTNSLLSAGGGPAIVRIKGSRKALAMSLDGNGRYCLLDPYRGAMLAVAEAARNVVCAGALPIGATNCLNFGNPERPEIMWQFAEVVKGIGEACRALDIPITGGNVSFYNETDGKSIHPTPVIGVVGLIENSERVVGQAFPREKLIIAVVGHNQKELSGSEYLKLIHGLERGRPPTIDFSLEQSMQAFLLEAIRDGLVRSAHDSSDGGLAVALAECCFDNGGIGVDVDLGPSKDSPLGLEASLFGETASLVVISAESGAESDLLKRAKAATIPMAVIGHTGGTRLYVRVNGEPTLDLEVEEAERIWSSAIEGMF